MRSLLLVTVWAVASTATACSLCANVISRATFGEELDNAAIVVVGTLSNPKLNPNPLVPGGGTTELAIERLLKSDGSLGDGKSMTLPTYMPVPDPTRPPRMVVFLDRFRDKLTPLQGVAVKSDALIPYLEGLRTARAKGREAALAYCAAAFESPDATVALDAFLEFAKSKDADVAKAARTLDAAVLRRLVERPNLDSDRLSLFAFLLGSCGNAGDRDAETLLRLTGTLEGEMRNALDGVYAGYVALRPADGWKRLATIAGDPKQPFATRFAALRAVRCLQGWRGEAIKAEALAVYTPVIRDGELADLAVEDLRRWKWWDLTDEIASHLGKQTHRAPIVQHCLIRYALACPLPAGKAMVARAREIEPDYVEDQEKLGAAP